MMKYVCAFLAIIVGVANFFYAWFAPVDMFWQMIVLSVIIFAVSFGQFTFKQGEESAVFFLQLASIGFLMIGACNIAMIA